MSTRRRHGILGVTSVLLAALVAAFYFSPSLAQVSSNILQLVGTASGTFPILAAKGQDAVLGMNLVTKGGACVEINGICIGSGSGGTGVPGEIAVWNTLNTITGFADFTWDEVNERLVAGTGNTPAGFDVSIIGNTIDATGTTGDVALIGERLTNSGNDAYLFGEVLTNTGSTVAIVGVNTITNSGDDVQGIGERVTNANDDFQFLGEQITAPAGTCASCVVVGQSIDLTGQALNTALIVSTGGIAGNAAYVLMDSAGAGSTVNLGVTAWPNAEVQIAKASIKIPGIVAAGSAAGKRVVCIDNTTKILYTSATGTDCS